mmetsp:Transcript_65/g.105  ORF Transcript_65/g.105 Transcript_65/m.105 type:complete len:150 (+) Transcript_65:555-1004(+)
MVSCTGSILYINPEGVVWEGNMKKATKIMKTLQPRYFRLVQNPCQLWYYTDSKSSKARGGIDLFDEKGDPIKIILNNQTLQLKSPQRVFTCTAEDVATAKQWKEAIKEAQRLHIQHRAAQKAAKTPTSPLKVENVNGSKVESDSTRGRS